MALLEILPIKLVSGTEKVNVSLQDLKAVLAEQFNDSKNNFEVNVRESENLSNLEVTVNGNPCLIELKEDEGNITIIIRYQSKDLLLEKISREHIEKEEWKEMLEKFVTDAKNFLIGYFGKKSG